MSSYSSSPIPQLRDSFIALSQIHAELQAKILELLNRFSKVCESECVATSKGGSSLVDFFNSTIWPELSSHYEVLVNELVSYCRDELMKVGLRCMVYGRTKSIQSVCASLKRREQGRDGRFTDLRDIFYDMHDLAGIMIVAQSAVDVDRANIFVSECFQAVKKPNHWSADRPVGQHWDARFGNYESHNHHVSLKGDSECPAVIFEVQITTFKDFIYNHFAHPWIYKRSNGSLTHKDEIVLDIIHGAGHLIEMGSEYLIIREMENQNSIEVEHGLFTGNRPADGANANKNKTSKYLGNTRRIPRNTPTKELALVATDEILQAFHYDSSRVANDCDNILRMLRLSAQHLADDKIDEERVLAIQSHPRLRTWLFLDRPSMLLVDGRGNLGPRSEASVVSAKLVTALFKVHCNQDNKRISPFIIPLAFFCGEHRDFDRDPNGKATELALSLLLQLIEHGRGLIAHQSLRRAQDEVDPGDIHTLCSSLCNLITKLPSYVYVVIILDGVRFFDRPPQRQQETEQLIISLISLLTDRRLKATLKLLFTSPSRASWLEGIIKEDEILRLSRDLPAGAADNDLAWRRPLVLK